MNAHEQLLAMLAVRDARDTLERAVGWVVQVTHEDGLGGVLGLYGTFCEPAAALEYAATQEGELNEGEEDGFRCQVHPIMPVL